MQLAQRSEQCAIYFHSFNKKAEGLSKIRNRNTLIFWKKNNKKKTQLLSCLWDAFWYTGKFASVFNYSIFIVEIATQFAVQQFFKILAVMEERGNKFYLLHYNHNVCFTFQFDCCKRPEKFTRLVVFHGSYFMFLELDPARNSLPIPVRTIWKNLCKNFLSF